jgi:beta-N-acetylhexosaminidase
MVGFEGLAPSDDLRRILRDYAPGGIVLFARNVDGPAQVAELVRELQALAREVGQDVPLLVGIDQEGGRVARLREPWTVWPPMSVLGRGGSEDMARQLGRALASELRSCGIRYDFAPVVDVHTNPQNAVIGDRAFSDDPDLVGRLGAALVDGMQGLGVAACAKHFPGHGDTTLDSHLDLPTVDHSRSRLEDVELRPFRRCIEAGVASVMTAHVVAREIDDRLPASLSADVTRGLLRDHLEFSGVIVSDDLDMKAISARWRPGEAAVLCARAGCDLLLSCRDHDAQAETVEGLVRALEAEEIRWADMEAACGRVRGLKERFLLPYRDPSPTEARLAAGTWESWALAREIAERGGGTA